MRAFNPVLNRKGLLAASIALFSGHALAEDAGRVSFVSGDVSASAPDGSARILRKGDVIHGGDRISTGAGRLQIRFTDGGFVSLQPNTVFGIDQYLYANRKPEETSLFFSLLQGGLRTITGAIGKVNKQSYKVHTPVATIGIRGTEYLATVTPTGLIVSVGAGFVNVSNEHGDITGGAGQNIVVTLGEHPEFSSLEPIVPAAGPNDTQPQGAGPASVGNAQDSGGGYIFLSGLPNSLPSSNLATGKPPYLLTYGYGSNAGSPVGVLAIFDQTGVSGAIGSVLDLYKAATVPANPAAPDFSRAGTGGDTGLRASAVGVLGNLSWGTYNNGTTSVNTIFDSCGDGCTGTISLAATDYLPYIIGAPALSNLAQGTATYTLQGGTLPHDSAGVTGTLDSFRIDVNLDFATMNVALQMTMPASTARSAADIYYVTTPNAMPVGVANIGTNNQFHLDSFNGDLSITDSGGSCGPSGSSSCSANIGGFFSGAGAAQIGASYEISNLAVSDTFTGVAALGLTQYSSTTALPSGPGYSAAYAYHGSLSAGSTNITGFSGGYNYGTFNDNSLNAQFDASDALQSATQNGTTQFDRGTGALADDTGSVGALKWGRWYSSNANGDTVTTPESTPSTATLALGDYLHYIVGPMTEPNIFAAFAANTTATYTYQGGTTATGTDGSTGQIASGSTLTVTFGTAPTLAADLNLNMSSGGGFQVTGSGIPINVTVTYATTTSGAVVSGTANFAASGSGLSASGSACGSAGTCSASLQGFFAGQQAQQIGLGYSISDPIHSRTVNGAAAFGR